MAVIKGMIKGGSQKEIIEFVDDLVSMFGDDGVEVSYYENFIGRKESVIEFADSLSKRDQERIAGLCYGHADRYGLSQLGFEWHKDELQIHWNS